MEQVSKILKQTSFQLLGKAITSLSTIFSLIIITRYFSESGVGIYTLALNYLAFFYLIADFGINADIISKFSSDNLERVWQKLFGMRIILALALIIIALFLINFYPGANDQFKMAVLIGSLTILFSAIFVTANAFFQKQLRYDLSIIASSFGAALTLLSLFFLSQSSFPLPYLMFSSFIGWFICALVALSLVKKFIKIAPLFDLSFFKKTLKDVWPISATLIINALYFRIDSFLIPLSHSFADAGVYNLSYSIFQTALVIPTFIMNSYYPLMLEQFERSRFKFFKSLNLAIWVMLALGILGTILTYFLSPFLIYLITWGKGFLGSVQALQILSLSFPAYFVSALLIWTLVVLKKYKLMLLIYLIGLGTNLVLNIIFIPKYSYFAAALITGVSEYLILILQIVILFFKFKR